MARNESAANIHPTPEELRRIANRLRADILEMVIAAKGGHIGGSFSVIDVLTALYCRALRHDPAKPQWAARDRLVFSKGHSCLALYNVLAECGYFPRTNLDRYCVDGELFAGHPEHNLTPGVEATTGSLGHGLPLAVGMALAAKLDGADWRTFAILGDGECNEGSVWEAMMAGPQCKLDRLTLIVDSNKLESLDRVANILNIEPLAERIRNFGWAVREIDGHDMAAIVETLEGLPIETGKPSAIVANTVKGKGVSFMENVTMWHYRGPSVEEAAAARAELKDSASAMRDAFIAELHVLAAEDPRVLLMSGDIGFKVFDRFRDAYPSRFFNLGIAEANMVGMSAGLAMNGKRPFVYTIIPFLTMRAFEQIRVDLCMHELPVRVVGVGGGLAYDILGPTHHSIEDVAILRALPNMTVVVPSDPILARAATRAIHALPRPAYLRLGKNGEPVLPGSDQAFALGRALTRREGEDVAIIGCGPILKLALDASSLLSERGLSCRIIDMHTVKPIDAEAIVKAARETRALVTLEEHSIIGGLGSAVAEVLAEAHLAIPFKRLGVPDVFTCEVGSQAHLWRYHGLTAPAIAKSLEELFRVA